MPPGKLERVDEGEIRRRWSALDLPKRQAAMHFEDPGLVTCIRNAVQNLFQKQVVMAKLGMWQGHDSEPDLLLDSTFLKDIFDLPWIVEKSAEFKDAVLMNPEIQPALMTLRPAACEGCIIFDRLSLALPDFLGSKTGRSPLPRARWKQLWAIEPSSVAAFEQQLAKLAEQALWALGLSSSFEAPREESQPQETVEVEDWMLDSDVIQRPKTGLKSKKKKKTKSEKRGIDLNVDTFELQVSARFQDVTEKGAGEEESASCPTCDSDEAVRPLEQSCVHHGTPEGAGVAGDARLAEPEVSQAFQETQSSVEDVAPERQVLAGDAMLAESEVSQAGQDTVSQAAQDAVAHQYWQWHSDMERTTAFQWCLPSNPFSRGYWSSSRSRARVEGPSAVVRNTFIDIVEEDGSSQAHLRKSRSLSPRDRKSVV